MLGKTKGQHCYTGRQTKTDFFVHDINPQRKLLTLWVNLRAHRKFPEHGASGLRRVSARPTATFPRGSLTSSIAEMIARLEALPRPPSIEERDDEELPEPAGL
jgi:hypothetical protein